MIDLILVDKDTCIFGNEISVQGDVSCGAKAEERFNTYITNRYKCSVNWRTVLPVRYGERNIGGMTKHFIDERLSEGHLGLI